MHHRRRVPLFAVAVLATAAFVACGSSEPDPSASGSSTSASEAGHNQADIEFLQGMTPHHEQAVEMSEMAAGRSENAEVLDLAERIRSAQQPEIDQMNGLLAGWGVEAAGGGHGGGHGGGGHPGMMDDAMMAELEGARGADFDRRFLEGMIAHHRGAVTASLTELEAGEAPEAKELAQAIIDAQEAEIAEMEQLLSEI